MMLPPKDCFSPLKAKQHERENLAKLEQLLVSDKFLKSCPKLVNSKGEEIELPESVYKALYQVVEAMASGTSITILPIDRVCSIEETALMLNVSKEYVNRLLEKGDIPYTEIGTTKQINCQEVLKYKQIRDTQRQHTLNELTALMQEDGFYQ